jgi:hypothetical protein
MADAIISLLQNHPEGLRNVEVAKLLGLESEPHESQRNYFTWKILAHLVNDGRIEKSNAPHAKYRLIEI